MWNVCSLFSPSRQGFTESRLCLPVRVGVILCVIFSVLSPAANAANTMDTLDFQGYIKDSTGSEVITPTDIKFSIYDMPVAGALLWQETFTSVVVTNGSFFVNLGGGAVPLPIGTLAETHTSLFLEIEVITDGAPMSP